jgi:hypothetical protein
MFQLRAHRRLVSIANSEFDGAVSASVAQQVAVMSPREQRAISRREERIQFDYPNLRANNITINNNNKKGSGSTFSTASLSARVVSLVANRPPARAKSIT